MFKTALVLFTTYFMCSCTTATYYIVRHTEKEPAVAMTSDVPLSEGGRQRAEALRDLLRDRKIRYIYSTNFMRTTSTATPLSRATGVEIRYYQPRDSSFPERLKVLSGNVLVIGHSNTVDDLVNGITGTGHIAGDLPDSRYGDLFIVRKKAGRYHFEQRRFGQ